MTETTRRTGTIEGLGTMAKRYAIAVQTNDEGVLEVWQVDGGLSYRDVNEAQEHVRRNVPAGQSVIIVPMREIPAAAALLRAVPNAQD